MLFSALMVASSFILSGIKSVDHNRYAAATRNAASSRCSWFGLSLDVPPGSHRPRRTCLGSDPKRRSTQGRYAPNLWHSFPIVLVSMGGSFPNTPTGKGSGLPNEYNLIVSLTENFKTALTTQGTPELAIDRVCGWKLVISIKVLVLVDVNDEERAGTNVR